MKSFLFHILWGVMILGIFWSNTTKGSPITQSVSDHPSNWMLNLFSKGKIPPFSFIYDGKHSDNFIKNWAFKKMKISDTSASYDNYVFTYSEPGNGLIIDCHLTVFKHGSVAEWKLNISNSSKLKSKILERISVLNNSFNVEENFTAVINSIKGSIGAKDDFRPYSDTLSIKKTKFYSPAGGRSSDKTAMPFFTVQTASNGGFVAAIGWTGKWFADFNTTKRRHIRMEAGMENIKLYLNPNEKIRTPAISLLFWKGEDPMTGNNRLREFIVQYKTRNNAQDLPLAISLSPNYPTPCNGFFGCLTDSFALRKIDWLKKVDIVPDVCWMDAGWYKGGSENWQIVGDWKAEDKVFPLGLNPVIHAVHALGSKFLLWFEPERVCEDAPIAKNHPGWMMNHLGNVPNKYTGKLDLVLNLGDSIARIWLTDYVSDFIRQHKIDLFRQDFNIDPLPFWLANDPPGRTGISEIRYIEGLYSFWDSLLNRFPDLVIDNCASGARRIDMESISRTSTLWRSDYDMSEPEGLQSHFLGLHYFLPFHGTGSYSHDPYGFRSSMGNAMVLFWNIENEENTRQMKKRILEFKLLRPYFKSDYYPLLGAKDLYSDSSWIAYQFNRPEKSDGILMAFRRKRSISNSATVKIKGLNQNDRYLLVDLDTGKHIFMKGYELKSGIKLSLEDTPASLIYLYRKIPD